MIKTKTFKAYMQEFETLFGWRRTRASLIFLKKDLILAWKKGVKFRTWNAPRFYAEYNFHTKTISFDFDYQKRKTTYFVAVLQHELRHAVHQKANLDNPRQCVLDEGNAIYHEARVLDLMIKMGYKYAPSPTHDAVLRIYRQQGYIGMIHAAFNLVKCGVTESFEYTEYYRYEK